MRRWAIMQEAGPVANATRRWGSARPKRRGTVEARTPKEALIRYVEQAYPPGHAQFAGGALFWAGSWEARRWRPDDGTDRPGRRWLYEVCLQNGERNVHTIKLYAWNEGPAVEPKCGDGGDMPCTLKAGHLGRHESHVDHANGTTTVVSWKNLSPEADAARARVRERYAARRRS